MKYMVMECHPGYAVLLDEQGRIQKAANFHYQVGQLVENPVFMQEHTSVNGKKLQAFRGVAIAAACLILVLGFVYHRSYRVVYSSIYMSINPEIQMDLNKKGKVIHLIGKNKDGNALLDGYNIKGKEKEFVVDELVDRAIAMGYLKAGGKVEFSIDTPESVNFEKYGTEIETEIKKHLKGTTAVSVEIKNYRTSEPLHEEVDFEEEDIESEKETEAEAEVEMEQEDDSNDDLEENEMDNESESEVENEQEDESEFEEELEEDVENDEND